MRYRDLIRELAEVQRKLNIANDTVCNQIDMLHKQDAEIRKQNNIIENKNLKIEALTAKDNAKNCEECFKKVDIAIKLAEQKGK